MRGVEILLAFPNIILALGCVGVLGPSVAKSYSCLWLPSAVDYAITRVSPGLVLSIKEQGSSIPLRSWGDAICGHTYATRLYPTPSSLLSTGYSSR